MDVALQLSTEHRELVRRRGADGSQVGRPLHSCRPQVGEGGPIGLADRGIAARQRHVAQVAHPFELAVAGDQHLSAPDRAVGPVPGSVEREPDHAVAFADTVLRHHRRDVGVVVLDELDRGEHRLLGPAAGLVRRVGVGDEPLGRDLVHLRELPGRSLERIDRRDAAHVTDVLAHPRVGTSRDTERVLQLAPDGQRWNDVEREAYRQRRVATGPADRELLAVDHAHDRVVARDVDRAVVDEPGVGDPAESLPGIGIVVTDRLVAEVAAGHHERGQRLRSRAGHGAEQQVVQWRVREQHADERIARRHQRRQAAVVPVSHEHDRPLRAGEQLGFCRIDDGQAPGRLEIADHDGERLVAPALARAQLGKRRRRARVARQVIATEPLDRDDRAVGQQALRTGDRRVGAVDRPGRRLEPQARPARRGTRPAGRGTADHRGRDTASHTPGRTGTPASSCSDGRTGGGR